MVEYVAQQHGWITARAEQFLLSLNTYGLAYLRIEMEQAMAGEQA